ncbi:MULTISPECIES: SDR family NAD(P)-dependent oxidoreductase [Methylobacterium]|uniref:3-oxoacyl-[acyl-carrier-protein] reductase FabG n=1 Tax=Methylobacterium thuringiense TaxID=1003091 RepID=A0ABQ4TEN6_9HYPH|nr:MULTISPECIES: SDR family oxidoreductase [Methylobacterium]TXN24281.1 SDR family oxidoreductase [Methylobacterium sp. WL9]GJE53834.1 3-oxoacyl-[acyl-carrier-protein] reductase FabG [Methylobacterium thuringiense]
MDLGISGRVAVVTGGDSGMGYTSAEYLLREGVKIVLSDIKDEAVQDAAKRLSALGEVRAFAADLSSNDGAVALRAFADTAFGQKPTILVNAAGVTGATGDFLEIDDAGWLETIQADLMGAVRMARAFIPGMREAGWGRIVLFTSEDAVQPYVEELPYCAAKAGLMNLTKGLSKAYGPDGVLVNSVAPAYIATPMTDAMMEKRAEEMGVSFDRAIETFLDEKRPGIVAKRRGRVEEVAAAVAFLCSEQASFITGENLRVDGGAVLTMAS